MFKNIKIRKKYLIIVVICVFICLKITFVLINNFNNNSIENVINQEEKEEQIQEEENSKSEANTVYVDVKGAVVNPGLYEVDSSFRVGQVIEQAGGFSHANTQCVNLSQKIVDEQLIYIPKDSQKCETSNNNSQNNLENQQNSSNNASSSLININTATEEELITLTGIGESRAKDIIAYREDNGDFSTKEELKNVKGIGEEIYKNIEAEITV
ncbi:MAG: helix-hairpin-helix domain-containing protein [Mycoplasmatales bacterium]